MSETKQLKSDPKAMTVLLTIFAIILALPLQMAGFSKALAHMQEHSLEKSVISHSHAEEHQGESRHSHSAGHRHSHESPEHEHGSADVAANTSPDEHSHGDDPTSHSHAKELSLTFLQYGSERTAINILLKPSYTSLEPVFEAISSISHQSFLSLLRPPIQA